VPVDDNNTWNPYQVAEITVKDNHGNLLAQTRATVPTSDEINCAKCHGSPHAMYPSRETADNYQPDQYQGSKIKTIGSCGVCHSSSRGESQINEFNEVHGGTNPEKSIGCRACHTSIPSATSNWPHAYTWKNSN